MFVGDTPLVVVEVPVAPPVTALLIFVALPIPEAGANPVVGVRLWEELVPDPPVDPELEPPIEPELLPAVLAPDGAPVPLPKLVGETCACTVAPRARSVIMDQLQIRALKTLAL